MDLTMAYNHGYEHGYEQGKKDAVKRGRWEWKNGKPFCSACKKQGEPKHHFEDGTVEEYDYCSNCGARMEGE